MSSSPRPPLLRPPSFRPAAVEWAPGGKPRYVVINPMHIITLQDRTRTFAVRLVEKLKAISERWFTHVLLLLFLLIYASLGALLFQWIEAPLELGEKQSINRTRELIIENLWTEAQVRNESDWVQLAYKRMKAYEGQLQQHLMSKAPPDSAKTAWTFWGSLFYAGTIFTTIGYGNIVPATTAGQAATIVYAFIGIPFLLMVLADLGKLFTRAIKAVFYYIKLFYHTGKFRKARKMGRRATAVPVQYMTVAWNKMPYMVYQGRNKKSANATPERDAESGTTEEGGEPLDKLSESQSEEKLDIDSKQKDKMKKTEEEEMEETVIQETVEDDDEFNLPVSLAIILLLAYMMLGAIIFTIWEDWTFFESFYFVFISMSTIGFGDFVPDHPMYMMATFIYLLFGLALTSMCINVIQEKLSATFEMAKLRIGTTIGLDASILMEAEVFDKSDTPDGSRKSRRGSKAPPSLKSEIIENKTQDTEEKQQIKNGTPHVESTLMVNETMPERNTNTN